MINEARVEQYPDLVKKGGVFVVNTNSEEYRKAQARIVKTKKERNMESRITALESKIDSIFEFIKGIAK